MKAGRAAYSAIALSINSDCQFRRVALDALVDERACHPAELRKGDPAHASRDVRWSDVHTIMNRRQNHESTIDGV